MKNLIIAFLEALKYMMGCNSPAGVDQRRIDEYDLQPALEIIKEFEGFRSQAYQDSVGVWTIGWGTTTYPDGNKVRRGDSVDRESAEHFLENWVKRNAVETIKGFVAVPLKYHQFIALVSLIYNIGPGNFRRSTMLRLINQGKMSQAAEEFPKWRKAGGKVLKGLVRRRAIERDIFENGLPERLYLG